MLISVTIIQSKRVSSYILAHEEQYQKIINVLNAFFQLFKERGLDFYQVHWETNKYV